MNGTIEALTSAVIRFRDQREWKQFHTVKDNALSILIEASELAEEVRWKSEEEMDTGKVGEELADILYWVLLTAHDSGVDLQSAFDQKMIRNAELYPVELSKGSRAKYSDLPNG